LFGIILKFSLTKLVAKDTNILLNRAKRAYKKWHTRF